LEPRSFSFNSPYGACPDCTGLGTRMEVDPELVVSDPELTLEEGAIAPWSGGHTTEYFGRLVDALARTMKFRTDVPWHKLPAKSRDALLTGTDKEVHVKYRNRYGRERSYYSRFEGVLPYIERRHGEAESDAGRERFEGYMREVPCPVCDGSRLKPESLAVTLGERSIAEVARMCIEDVAGLLR